MKFYEQFTYKYYIYMLNYLPEEICMAWNVNARY